MFKKLILTSVFALAGAALVSANNSYYVGASALGGKSDDFKVFGGAAQIGYRVAEKVGVEFEAGYLYGQDKQTLKGVEYDVTDANGAKTTITQDSKIKAKLNQVPLFLNARYMDTVGNFNYYVGAGLGVNIMSAHVDWTNMPAAAKVTAAAGTEPLSKRVRLEKSHKTAFAAQVFGGFGYAFTEQLSMNAGVRLVFSEKFKIKAKGADKALFSTGSFMPLAEVALNYAF